jgi:geranylgeranyl diphosphate synthase, type I
MDTTASSGGPAVVGQARRANVAHMATAPAGLPRLRDQVQQVLEDFLDRQRPVLDAISGELLPWLEATGPLLAGGKRLRPAFCYWGWRAAGGTDCPQIISAASALELLHASALVHDDVMDASETRRGGPAVHRRFAARHEAGGWRGSADAFGMGAAILIGDLLQSWTDELLHGSNLPGTALLHGRPVLDAMRTEVIAGQYLDLLSQAGGDDSLESALRVVSYKSAKYTIERPLHLGVALACATADPDLVLVRRGEKAIADACTAYGIPLGIAFQLRDDVLGIFGDPAETGKPVSGDLREGKRTVLIAMARRRASAAQAEILDRYLGDRLVDEAGAAAVREVIMDTGALAECEEMIDRNVAAALGALGSAPMAGPAKEALAELAFAATARSD